MESRIMQAFLVLVALLMVIGCMSERKSYADRMEAEHRGDAPVANAASQIEQSGEVVTETVAYATVDGDKVTGYLAKPIGVEKGLPGVVVIHEWWGLNDNIRMMTRRLAGEGYAALAVDLYDDQTADTPDKARQYVQQVSQNPESALDNLEQAVAYLAKEQDAENIGTIGWCFGGGWSLRTALEMPGQVDATVIYYGQLVQDPDRLQKLEMPILGIFGAEDQGIPKEEVEKFEKTLDQLGKEADIHIYEGADHAFANPSGNRYNKEAAEDAWQKTVTFFEEHLKES